MPRDMELSVLTLGESQASLDERVTLPEGHVNGWVPLL